MCNVSTNDIVKEEKPVTFTIVGLLISEEFQQCQYIVNKLHQYHPDKYSKPSIRPMFDVDWIEFLTKARRKYHNKLLWKSKAPVAVLKDDSYLGDNVYFLTYIRDFYVMNINEDFVDMGRKQAVEYFNRMHSLGRKFVYFYIRADNTILGPLLIMLYADLVPKTCEFFLSRCERNVWSKSTVCRVVPGSWVQFRIAKNFHIKIACENYAVPHDRRGVVCMTNYRRHVYNTTNFHISLAPTPWMNHNYVAFGQVIQGEETLQALEKIKTDDERPLTNVLIETCGVFTLKEEAIPDLDIIRTRSCTDLLTVPSRDTDSIIQGQKLQKGSYCMESDLRSYFPFLCLTDRLLAYLIQQKRCEEETEEQEEEADDDVEEEANEPKKDVGEEPDFDIPEDLYEVDKEAAPDSAVKVDLLGNIVKSSSGFMIRTKEDIERIYSYHMTLKNQ